MSVARRMCLILLPVLLVVITGCKFKIEFPSEGDSSSSAETPTPGSERRPPGDPNSPLPPGAVPSPRAEGPVGQLPGPCAPLKASGPLNLTSADSHRVIENLDITSDGVSAIRIDGAEDITLRNLRIRHTRAKGIEIWNSKNIRLEAVSVKYLRPSYLKPADPNDDLNRVNISCDNSSGFVASHVRLEDGSSGIRTFGCAGTHLSFIEGHNFRGPWTTGPFVQLGRSPNSILEDFSAENDRYNSFVEDIVSIWNSGNCIVRRGLVDGNNSPAGVGIMFELHDPDASGGLAEDIDAVRQGNGCFAAYPGNNVTFRRTRCYKNICEPQRGTTPPASNGVGWGIHPQDKGIRILESTWSELCNRENAVWDRNAVEILDLKEAPIQNPKQPLRLQFCFEP